MCLLPFDGMERMRHRLSLWLHLVVHIMGFYFAQNCQAAVTFDFHVEKKKPASHLFGFGLNKHFILLLTNWN